MKKLLPAILLLACLTAHGQHFDRGINKSVFVPKGQWLTGGTCSYTELGFDDFKLVVMDNMNGEGYTLSVSPFLGYFVKDNMAIGARFSYQRTFVRINTIDLDLGDDLTFNIKDYYNLQHVYSGTIMMRNYVNLGQSKRFGLFNEVRLTAGGGQGKSLSGKGTSLTGTYQNVYEYQLGLAPGMVAFITDNVGVEVSVGVLGYKYRKVKQITDQTTVGTFTKSSANFKIDLFSISLGVSFYIPSLNPGRLFHNKNNSAAL